MSEFFEANKRAIILLLVVMLLFLVVLYFLLLRPLSEDLASKEASIEIKQNELLEVTRQIAVLKDETNQIDIEQLMLEKQIPSNRDLDSYILTLEELESVTASYIDSIRFLYDSSIPDIEEESDDEKESSTEENDGSEVETDENDDEVEEEIEPIEDRQIVREKPEELEVLIVRVDAVSPDYDAFIELIEAIEDLERISIITNLKYETVTEEDKLSEDFDDDNFIPFSVELTTFYYPSE